MFYHLSIGKVSTEESMEVKTRLYASKELLEAAYKYQVLEYVKNYRETIQEETGNTFTFSSQHIFENDVLYDEIPGITFSISHFENSCNICYKTEEDNDCYEEEIVVSYGESDLIY